MTKDLQLKVRVDNADKQRLEDLAAHYSAPAATVVRMLVKEKHDTLVDAGRVESIKTPKVRKR